MEKESQPDEPTTSLYWPKLVTLASPGLRALLVELRDLFGRFQPNELILLVASMRHHNSFISWLAFIVGYCYNLSRLRQVSQDALRLFSKSQA
jgi:hypothetical protein